MSFFAELQRRNVIKMAIVYILASWMLLQVADVVFPALRIPDWGITLVLALLALGFPIALIFSWVYEITPEGIRLEKDVAPGESITHETSAKLNYLIAGLLVVIAALLALNLVTRPAGDSRPEADASEPPAQPVAGTDAPDDPEDGPTSVAVLPFVNMSNDPDNAYFSEGISEELLNVLVRVEGLRVPSRTSSFAFKGRDDVAIRDIARELDVDHVLEGSVRKAGNRVRITAQLIDVDTDSHLWSETYDRELEDIFAVQDEIANAIVNALKATLAGGELPSPGTTRLTDNLAAYELYLQGRYLVRQREYANLVRAAELLERAVALDPGFAKAWAALAAAYNLQPNYLRDVSLRDESVPARAQQAAERALALDPTLAEAQAVLGALYRRDPATRGKGLETQRKAAELDPTDSTAQLWYGIALFEFGYLREALPVLTKAQSLDPASGVHNDWLTRIHGALGHRDEMEHYAAKARTLRRSYQEHYRAGYALMDGDPDRFLEISLASMELVPEGYAEGHGDIIREVAAALKDPALVPEALAAVHAFEGFHGGSYAALGAVEPLLGELAMRYRDDPSILTYVWAPWNDDLRRHPAFIDFAEQTGLVGVWRERGWPDLCRPAGDSFECD